MKQPAYKSEPIFAVTCDVDWASEDAIRIQQGIFDEHDVRATYFVTHESPILRELFQAKRIDLGIHPNFLPNSSHGETFEEVLDTVLTFAPESRCSRSHRYFDAAPVTQSLVKRGFRYDANLCTNLQKEIAPIRHESGLIRFPCFYEDGTHSWQRLGWDFADFKGLFTLAGIKILSVHPMTIAMNATSQDYWAELKRKFPPQKWIQMEAKELAANACREQGPKNFLEEMLAFIKKSGFQTMTMDELYQHFGHEDSLQNELHQNSKHFYVKENTK